jgi:hypothetical protein
LYDANTELNSIVDIVTPTRRQTLPCDGVKCVKCVKGVKGVKGAWITEDWITEDWITSNAQRSPLWHVAGLW